MLFMLVAIIIIIVALTVVAVRLMLQLVLYITLLFPIHAWVRCMCVYQYMSRHEDLIHKSKTVLFYSMCGHLSHIPVFLNTVSERKVPNHQFSTSRR